MQNPYENYLAKDSHGGAALSHFPHAELHIHESELYALDITHCPNLQRVVIHQLNPERTPHLSFYQTPALQEVVLERAINPAIVHLHAEDLPAEFVIHGELESVDAYWGDIAFTLDAYRKNAADKTPWAGMELVQSHNFASFSRRYYLAVLTGDLSSQLASYMHSTGALMLSTSCQWALLNVRQAPEIICNGRAFNYFKGLPDTHTLRFLQTSASAYIEDAPQLETVVGDGQRLSLQLICSQQKTLNLLGEWKNASLRAERLETLNAPKVKALMLLNAPYLKTVDLALNTPVECRGVVPAPLSQSARFYFHESTVKSILQRLFEGEAELLPSLLNILPHASHRHQAHHSLNTLKSLCDVFVNPADIWRTRCLLWFNNTHKTHIQPSKGDYLIPDAWHWNFPDDLYTEAWLADLKIWDYCQQSVPEAAHATAEMARHYFDGRSAEALAKVFANSSISLSQKRLVARAMRHSFTKKRKADGVSLARLFGDDVARRIQYDLQRTPNNELKEDLIYVLCHLLEEEEFMEKIPPLVPLAPAVFRTVLLEMSHKGPNWDVCYNTGWRSRTADASAELARAKHLLLMMAMANFSAVTA